MRRTPKLSIEQSALIVDALGGGAQISRLLNDKVTRAAVSQWKRHGMPLNNAALLKVKSPRHPIWKEIRL